MTEQDLAAIEARARAVRTAHQIKVGELVQRYVSASTRDIPALVAEVRRLRALVEALERGQGQAIQDALDLDADARWEL
jgi:DNA-binding transcriptional regulator YbjK